MDTSAIRIFVKHNRLSLFVATVGSVLLFPMFLDIDLLPTKPGADAIWASLDPSWMIAMNYANIQDLTWGTDFGFTYGPLAFLSTRVGWGVSKYWFLLFDLFVAFNFFCLFFIQFKKSTVKVLSAVFILSICMILPYYLGAGYAFVLLVFLVFWILNGIENENALSSIMQILLVVLLFFIKFNTGLVALIFFIAAITYKLLFTSQNKRIQLSCLIICCLLIVSVAQWLNVALLSYIKVGYETVAGYNEIMYLNTGIIDERNIALGMLGLSSILFIWSIIVKRDPFFKKLLSVFLFGSTLFVLYKQAFIRADVGHVMEFFNFALLILFCFDEITNTFKSYIRMIILIAIIATGIYVITDYSKARFKVWNKFNKERYLSDFSSYSHATSNQLQSAAIKIPDEIRNRIGNGTADIFPWNVSQMLENGLNYQPRPVCQAYAAYTPYLQKRNADFYASDKAPQFVLYDYASIDNRYPLFDEPEVTLTLVRNYKVVDSFSYHTRPMLLLERKSTRALGLRKIAEYVLPIDQPIVPKDGIYYKITVGNSLRGKIISLLDYSPELSLEIRTKGKSVIHRTSKGLLESGLFSKYHIEDVADFKKLMPGHYIDSESVISGYYIRPLDPADFDSEILVSEYAVE